MLLTKHGFPLLARAYTPFLFLIFELISVFFITFTASQVFFFSVIISDFTILPQIAFQDCILVTKNTWENKKKLLLKSKFYICSIVYRIFLMCKVVQVLHLE